MLKVIKPNIIQYLTLYQWLSPWRYVLYLRSIIPIITIIVPVQWPQIIIYFFEVLFKALKVTLEEQIKTNGNTQTKYSQNINK